MNSTPIVIERKFSAPIEKVWRAITNNDEMKKWYFQLPEFKPEIGFKFQFEGGSDADNQYVHLCEVTEVIEGKKITYTWKYEGMPGSSAVTWELFEQGDDTLLKLTHVGVESFAEGGKDFTAASFNAGWNSIVNSSLEKYLAEN